MAVFRGQSSQSGAGRSGAEPRRASALVALLAVMLQVIAQAWHAPVVPAGTIRVDGETPLVAICTLRGTQWVPVTEFFGGPVDPALAGALAATTADAEPEPEPPMPMPMPLPLLCGICLTLGVAFLLVAVVLALVRPMPGRRLRLPVLAAAPVTPVSMHAPIPRGPPVLA